MFLNQTGQDYVYWVERTGRTQKNLALNAAPIDVAKYLRQRLYYIRFISGIDIVINKPAIKFTANKF